MRRVRINTRLFTFFISFSFFKVKIYFIINIWKKYNIIEKH